jgi:hypothetical protein
MLFENVVGVIPMSSITLSLSAYPSRPSRLLMSCSSCPAVAYRSSYGWLIEGRYKSGVTTDFKFTLHVWPPSAQGQGQGHLLALFGSILHCVVGRRIAVAAHAHPGGVFFNGDDLPGHSTLREKSPETQRIHSSRSLCLFQSPRLQKKKKLESSHP